MTGLRPNSSWADFNASSDFNPVLATDVYSPNGTVASVTFYAGTGTGSTPLGTATYADDNGNWTIDVSPSSLGGATSVTIVVTDTEGVTNGSSGTTFSISPVSLGQITVDTGDGSGPTTTPVYTSGTSVSISVASLLTTNSGASIAGVKFYLDTSGTGIYNPSTVQLLTGTLTSNGTGGFTLSGVNTSGWIGDQTLFVVAADSTGATNCPVQFQLVAAPAAQPVANPNPFKIAWNAITQVGADAFGLAQDTWNFIANQASQAYKHLAAGDINGLVTQAQGLVTTIVPIGKIITLINLGAAGRGQLVALLAGNPALLKAVKNALRPPLNFLHARWNEMGLSKVPFPDIDKMSADDIATILTCSMISGHFAPAGCLVGVLIVANRHR